MGQYRVTVGDGMYVTLAAESEQAAVDGAVEALASITGDDRQHIKEVLIDRKAFTVTEIVAPSRDMAQLMSWIGDPPEGAHDRS